MSRALDRLRSAFLKPGADDAPLALWFWNGQLHEAELGRQLAELSEQGLGGVAVQARESLQTPYLGERWWDAVDYTVRKARAAGLPTWVSDDLGRPSGPAGAPDGRGGQTESQVLAQGREHRAKTLARTIHRIEGPADVPLEGRFPAGTPLTQVAGRLDANGDLEPDTLQTLPASGAWSCPEGDWRLLSFSVRSVDDRIDYLRPATVQAFIDAAYEAYAQRYADDLGEGIPGVFFAEPSITAQPLPWTDELAARFAQDKGYDLLDLLPLLVLRGGRQTIKVRCDFYDVVAALYTEAWFEQISAWCEARGLVWTGHTEELAASHPARQGDYFRTMRHVAIPGASHHGFRYARPRTVRASQVKPAVSIAALTGRERAMAEAFGGAGWGVTLDELRHGASLLAAYGVSRQVLHGLFYSMSTADAADDWPPSLGRQNPGWPYFKHLTDYTARLSAVVGRSKSATTVGVFYPWSSIAANTADGRPNARAREIAAVFEGLIDGLIDASVDVHVVDEQFLCKARLDRGTIKQGAVQMSTLVLPPMPVASRAAMRRLGAFARSGGTLVMVGDRPVGSSDQGANDRSISRAIGSLCGAASATPAGAAPGRGRVFELPEDLAEALPRLVEIIQPGTVVQSSADVIALQREVDGASVLVVVNRSPAPAAATITTDAPGGPQVWNPEDGSMAEEPLTVSRGHRRLRLTLPAHAARLVVFDASAKAKRRTRERPGPQPQVRELETDWSFVLAKGTLTGQGSVRRLELPVMRVASYPLGHGRLEQLRDPEFDDSDWRETWLVRAGAEIIGHWSANWITGVRQFGHWGLTRDSGKHRRLRFTRTLEITEPPIKAWATFAGVDRATVYMNDTQLGVSEDWSNPVTYNIMPYLQPGTNTIVADVECTSAAPISLLFECSVDLRSGGSVVVVSDKSWDVQALPAEVWTGLGYESNPPLVTWERGRPPIQPWGQVPLLGEPVAFPRTLMYRQRLPMGCVGIGIPTIKGVHKVFVDVRERTPDINGTYNITTGRLLSVEIEAANFSNGILAPLTLYTRPTAVPLKPWSEFGYGWYSGAGIYERSFDLTAAQAEDEVRLDLGDVRRHAEVFVNNRPVGVRLWPPYEFDLSGHVRSGSNNLRVRVSNLLASEMRWKRDETRMSDPWHRYWHEENIEPDALVSGLLGPVRLHVLADEEDDAAE